MAMCSVVVSGSCVCFFFFKHKTAYEMRISDWSSDVCSSDLQGLVDVGRVVLAGEVGAHHAEAGRGPVPPVPRDVVRITARQIAASPSPDRKSTRLNSSH